MLGKLIDRPVATTMTLLVVIVLGFVAMRLLPVSLIPDTDVPVVTVQAESAGMSAREMDSGVLRPMCQQLMQINGLRDIVSEARDGSGTISLTFDHGADMDYIFLEANEKVDRSMSLLPEIQRPKVLKSGASDIPAFYINMTYSDGRTGDGGNTDLLTGAEDFLKLSAFASEVVAKRIEQLDEVAMVDISGTATKEILVIPDLNALVSMGISLGQFEDLVRSANVRLGSLVIRDGEYRYNVKFVSYAENKEDIENIYFKAGGKLMQLKDVAAVVEHPAPRTGMVRSDGREAVSMAVIKQNSARMSELKKSADNLLEHIRKDYPEVEFTITRDQTQLLDYSITILVKNIMLGILLAVIVIFLFMKDFRSPVLVAMTIPSALLFSMLVFYVIGLSINIISLSGLILGVGMMVDNAIILVDNITGHWNNGKCLKDAVVDGTKEVMGPMLSSVLTTCAVFIPLIFVSGIAGALFYDQAMSITIVLLTSYAVTITIIPVYYYVWYRSSGGFRPNRFLERISIGHAVTQTDGKIMSWFLRHRRLSWVLLAVCLPGSVGLFFAMQKERLPQITVSEKIVEIDWNEPLSIGQNCQRIAEVEEVIGDAAQMTSFVGVQQFLLGNSGGSNSLTQASIYVRCANEKQLNQSIGRVREYLGREYPKSDCHFRSAGNVLETVFADNQASLLARLRPVSVPVSSIVPSPASSAISSPVLMPGAVAGVIDSISHAFPGLSFPRIPVKKDVLFVADAQRMALYGVTYPVMIKALNNSLNQNKLFDIVQENRSVPVVLGTGNGNIEEIFGNTFVQGENADIPLSELMRQTFVEDFKTVISGTEGNYYPLPVDVRSSEASDAMFRIRTAVRNEGNFEVNFSGTYFSNRKMAEEMLIVLIIAIILLFLILASQFESLVQPLIILSEVIVDIFFCLLFLWCTGMTINLMSMIGLVVICGIVINDSILKIDTINKLRSSGLSLENAIMTASRRRLKAIIMTSLTTILSVVPLLGRGNMGADLQFPMSVVIVVGMVFGTFVSLFIVPALYYSIYRRKDV